MWDKVKKRFGNLETGAGGTAEPSAAPAPVTGDPLVDALPPLSDIAKSSEQTENALKLMNAHFKHEEALTKVRGENERELRKTEAETSIKIIEAVGEATGSVFDKAAKVLKPLAQLVVAMAVVMIAIVIIHGGLHPNLKLGSIPWWGKVTGLLVGASSLAAICLRIGKWIMRGVRGLRQLRAARKAVQATKPPP